MTLRRKYLWWSIGAISICLIVVCAIFVSAFSGWGYCANTVYSEEYSPDELHRAILFERNCGATTGFSTQISILDGHQKLEDESGNLYISGGHPESSNIKLRWLANQHLIVSNASEGALKAVASVGAITITYDKDGDVE